MSVRVGYVGVGLQGTSHVENLLKIEGVEIRAVCDIIEDRVARAQSLTTKAGFAKPEGYWRGPTDFKRLCERPEIDLVYTATPWEWHVPVALAAMNAGKHVAIEAPDGDHCRRMLAVDRDCGKNAQALRDDGELLLRPPGDDVSEDGQGRICLERYCTQKRATCMTCANQI